MKTQPTRDDNEFHEAITALRARVLPLIQGERSDVVEAVAGSLIATALYKFEPAEREAHLKNICNMIAELTTIYESVASRLENPTLQ